METDELCEWGYGDESFGFIECYSPAVEAVVFIGNSKRILVCAPHAAELRAAGLVYPAS